MHVGTFEAIVETPLYESVMQFNAEDWANARLSPHNLLMFL